MRIMENNVKNADVQRYNEKMDNSNEMYKYMQVNIVHLQDDIARFTRKGYSQIQLQKLTDLHKICISIQDKVTYNEQLSESEIKAFEEINQYNTAKNTELIRIAIFTVIIAVVGTIIRFFTKQ